MTGSQATRPLVHFLAVKLRQRGTYALTLIVGTLINVYGQLLVPYLRGAASATDAFVAEVTLRPGVALLSIALGYCFPLVVTALSGALTLRDMARRGHDPGAGD